MNQKWKHINVTLQYLFRFIYVMIKPGVILMIRAEVWATYRRGQKNYTLFFFLLELMGQKIYTYTYTLELFLIQFKRVMPLHSGIVLEAIRFRVCFLGVGAFPQGGLHYTPKKSHYTLVVPHCTLTSPHCTYTLDFFSELLLNSKNTLAVIGPDIMQSGFGVNLLFGSGEF